MASIIGVETLQHTNGTTAATIDSSGSTTFTKSINHSDLQHWSGYHDGTEVPGANNTLVNWTETEGNGITEAAGVWTIPEAGLYLLSISVISSASHGGIYWNVNDTKKWRITYGTPPSGGYSTQAGSVIHSFSANDTLKFTSEEASVSFYGASGTPAVGQVHIHKIG